MVVIDLKRNKESNVYIFLLALRSTLELLPYITFYVTRQPFTCEWVGLRKRGSGLDVKMTSFSWLTFGIL